MGLEVLQAVEVSVALGTVERAAARRVELELGSLGPHYRLPAALLQLLLALSVVPAQLAGLVEGLAADLAGMEAAGGLAGVTARPDLDSVHLWWGWDGGCLPWLEEVGEL